ncbi:MAG: YceD family protein [Burkholderiaceae bacterium]
MKIDLFEFARQDETASGAVPLTDLPRIETPDSRGSLAWSASGSTHGRHGALRLDLSIDGDVALTCQRCLQPMTESLRLRSKFLIANDEETADRMDQDDEFDVVVGSVNFDLDTLIEDEVILALPIAPRHAVCPVAIDEALLGTRKPSPFAALAALKMPSTARKVADDASDEDDL